ncbi:ubiquitin-conjugating enzyme E2 J1-like [Daphnia pulicaria]|uniref:ubiquitin-conjugating enzyme E2 J1-like n=1 Tax=Daphnia pulicaria TaxID=35523 RepID=UPI001EECC66C|nr:ubiquitin-conjugating enzyme E2 J1-like [Daphnia pulicaria]
MENKYNMKSPAVKRLMREAQELSQPTAEYFAQPVEDNLFEWHFSVRGPADSDFEGGVYHGRISLPPEYPLKPPSIMLLTPNGRFEVNRKICLSISGHHPESWLPSWSIRTALLAIIGFMPSPGMGAIASLDYTQEERQRLAKKSLEFVCPECGKILNLLQEPSQLTTNENEAVQAEAREIAAQVTMKGESNNENPTEEPASNTEEPIGVIQPPPPPSQQVQTASTNINNDLTYNYIIAAIIVALAILLFRRFASGTSAA